ncbi:50S ribosomal protein L11 methyltransferase [Marinimicrobium sp. ABcell2]|uniref:50S ribosomal protein L11 methyltransferase n=1 Tax=Marinimicrobium sp. ABcell2 TaxID=3069751 RepID=UPI0027B5AEB1|nr:50S ribosomal protein L11 methyltransferase [Marinimicrobium sp. ABcell2]MDQ2076133.1 50S ribosomal protein L11 methyltransferase [Marinimicrobium sp. ABcell2]
MLFKNRLWFKHRLLLGLLVLPFVSMASIFVYAEEDWSGGPPKLDVPFVTTPEPSVERMLELAQVTPQDTVIDLGSGDGRIVIAAVRDWGARRAVGVEIDPLLVRTSRENARTEGVNDRVTFKQGDLFEQDISDATVLTLFLLQAINNRLRPIILDTMAPGSRVVSHVFHMEDWEPDASDDYLNLYMWVVPAKVAGEWEVQNTIDDITLVLQQRFQEIEGYAVVSGDWQQLSNATLRGDEIRFTIDNAYFVGQVNGDRISATDEGNVPGWQAIRTSHE